MTAVVIRTAHFNKMSARQRRYHHLGMDCSRTFQTGGCRRCLYTKKAALMNPKYIFCLIINCPTRGKISSGIPSSIFRNEKNVFYPSLNINSKNPPSLSNIIARSDSQSKNGWKPWLYSKIFYHISRSHQLFIDGSFILGTDRRSQWGSSQRKQRLVSRTVTMIARPGKNIR